MQGGFELGISGMTAATVSHIYNGHDNCSINKPWIDCKAVSNANPVRLYQIQSANLPSYIVYQSKMLRQYFDNAPKYQHVVCNYVVFIACS